MCRSYVLDWCPSGGPLTMQPGLTPRAACHFRPERFRTADPFDYPHMVSAGQLLAADCVNLLCYWHKSAQLDVAQFQVPQVARVV